MDLLNAMFRIADADGSIDDKEVDAVFIPDVVQGTDVGMLEVRNGSSLTLAPLLRESETVEHKALQAVLRQSVQGIAGWLVEKYLLRDHAAFSSNVHQVLSAVLASLQLNTGRSIPPKVLPILLPTIMQ